MTNAAKATVWQAVWTPWGAPHSITGSAELNLRFPGQYFQIESGLHYNWHRHYDPTTARYTQPDPLRFVDGPSRYAYVGNSPLMKIDPTGLLLSPQLSPIPKEGMAGMCSVASTFMNCDDAYVKCLHLRGGLLKGSRVCGQARQKCLEGSITIFAPGIVGRPE
jgi:RHS repeat-associated protein